MLKIKEQYGLYTIKERLASDEERVCCRAADPFLGHDVILQLIRLPEQCKEEHLANFELRLNDLAGLNHPALAPIYDIGQEEGFCYYTMTFYHAGRLTENLKNPLAENDALRAIKHLTEGLAYAHAKGFEHGLFSVEDIFRHENGLPILANFGVNELLDSLYGATGGPAPPSQTPSLAQKQSFYSLGSLFLSLVLTAEQRTVPLVDQVVKLKGTREKQLITSLLGLSSAALTSYDALIRQLSEIIVAKEEPKASVSEQPAQQDIHPAPQEKAIPKKENLAVPEQKKASVPSAEMRNLVVETTRLQARLTEETEARRLVEQKLVLVEQALSESQLDKETARQDARAAWEMVDKQQGGRIHPVLWLAGGCLVGALFVGGLSYLQSDKDLQSAQAAAAEQRVRVQRLPIVAETADPLKTSVQKPVDNETSVPADLVHPQKAEVEVALDASSVPEETVVVTAAAQATQQAERLPAEEVTWVPDGEEFIQEDEGSLLFSVDLAKELSGEEKDKILTALQGWAKAWENQDFSAYLAHYSATYLPEAGRSREEWRMARQERLAKPTWIKIELADLQLRPVHADLVQVRLTQGYRADSYGDQTVKALDLVRENGHWRIKREQSFEEDGDQAGG